MTNAPEERPALAALRLFEHQVIVIVLRIYFPDLTPIERLLAPPQRSGLRQQAAEWV
jgi:hypothetical protein